MHELKDLIWFSAVAESPQLEEVDRVEIKAVLDKCITMLQDFGVAVRLRPRIYPETDFVCVISGPGAYTTNLPPYEDKPDKYQHFTWSRNMDRARIKTGLALVRQITALRLNKSSSQVTLNDIKKHGPWFHYGATRWEVNHLKAVLSQPSLMMPQEKVFSYWEIEEVAGEKREIANTADQMSGLRFPEKVVPRRIILVSHPPHLVRLLHILGKYASRIPQGAIVQPYPTSGPKHGREEFSLMELRGTLAAIYKLGIATPLPYPYNLH